MAENQGNVFHELDLLDWQIYRHHLSMYPRGEFYAITSAGFELRVRPYGAARHHFALDWHARDVPRVFQSLRTGKVGARTDVGSGYGIVIWIVFAEQPVTDTKLLKQQAVAAVEEVAKEWTAVQSVVPPDSTVKGELYFLVQKPEATYPSVFHGYFTSGGRLQLVLMRADANTSKGRLMVAPEAFELSVGGSFVTSLDKPDGETKPRVIGTILSIIRAPKYLLLNAAHTALMEARAS